MNRLKQAKDLLDNVSRQSLSDNERARLSVDLAGLMLEEANATERRSEKRIRLQLAKMLKDPNGRQFIFELTDQCFRSHQPSKVADKIISLLQQYGIPSYLPLAKRMALWLFRVFGKLAPALFVPLAQKMIRKETAPFIIPGESASLAAHAAKRKKEGIKLNFNHLGEAVLGEEEAERRLQVYINDLCRPDIEYMSIKISTIYSQISLLAWETTLNILVEKLKRLFLVAMDNPCVANDGSSYPKFINLDMEEYKDLNLTVEAFKRALDDPQFLKLSAGIALQAYLPDSFALQQDLTEWAKNRTQQGGAPIKIRIVKGANLAMEQVEASLKNWPQAPYLTKQEVDANFKRMVLYGCHPTNAASVHLGIGSHNLFDVAFALITRAENGVFSEVTFEMLEGMAEHLQRVVKDVSGGMLLYCPLATKEEFLYAIAYLVRRLDENTAPENFLSHLFHLQYGTESWQKQAELFVHSCQEINSISTTSRRNQSRFELPLQLPTSFKNEADTDWTVKNNQIWTEGMIQNTKNTLQNLPLVIGEEIWTSAMGAAVDPSQPKKILFRYSLADQSHIERAIQTAVNASKKNNGTSIKERSQLLANIAQNLRENRGQLIEAMIVNTAKTIHEADVEVSEAIDFAEYYRRSLEEFHLFEDIKWTPKGVILITPPWNFPCSISAGGILAALITGNAVIFKPAPEAVFVGWTLAQIFWDSGVSKETLQFITCEDEPYGSALIKDPRVSMVVLTGSTETAKHFMRLRPNLDIAAETGGKNSIIITEFADRDLAIKDVIHSAFSYSGQKCSACSLLICTSEVYDDPHFMLQLKDAASSLVVGVPTELSTYINPLIHYPNEILLKGLTELESWEEWLLKPSQDPNNENIWTPGIKIGVHVDSFSYRHELFGPMLSVMRANDLGHAIQIANGTIYGLTAGLHSLDKREHQYWLSNIEAGNCYINRGITGAIVQRQPFGGCKESSFGQGAKAGGPNYILQFMHVEQIYCPEHSVDNEKMPQAIHKLFKLTDNQQFSSDEVNFIHKSIQSYVFFWTQYFSIDHDPSNVLGETNVLRYLPQKVELRIEPFDSLLDIILVIAGTIICGASLEISLHQRNNDRIVNFINDLNNERVVLTKEEEHDFLEAVRNNKTKRVRFLSQPSSECMQKLAELGCTISVKPPLGNGRIELLQFLREVSISTTTHRYGHLE